MREIKRLDDAQLREAYRGTMREAFPPGELKPLCAIREMIRQGVYVPLGLFEDGDALGYIFMWLDLPYVLIDYLCVPLNGRNRGAGAETLQKAMALFPEDTVFIGEVEAPTGDPEKDGIIRRRLGFYDRCGAQKMDYDTAIFGVHYKTIAWSRGKPDNGAVMRRHAGFYRSRFSAGLYARAVQIPLRPGEKIRKMSDWREK